MPNLPTDNLYKFMAISGIIITILSIFVPYKKSEEFKLLLLEIEEEIDIIQATQEGLDMEIKWLEKLDPKEKKKRIREIIMKHTEIKILTAKMEVKLKKNEMLKNSIVHWKIIFDLLFFSGLCFGIGGFLLWYLLLQRPQDQILRKQLNELNNNTRK